jgi:hypothetical protein
MSDVLYVILNDMSRSLSRAKTGDVSIAPRVTETATGWSAPLKRRRNHRFPLSKTLPDEYGHVLLIFARLGCNFCLVEKEIDTGFHGYEF